MKQYIVDAFTGKAFTGNPAAVCVLEQWPSEKYMMQLAMENNLSETAFVVKGKEGYHLRWFTPGTEVELCGHATLATAFVILNYYEKNSDIVIFNTMSGILTVRKNDGLYEMYFPTYELNEIAVTDDMERAFGIRPNKAVLGMDLICIFDTEEQIKAMEPDQSLLKKLPGRIQNVTSSGKSKSVDCVSRSFCPKLSIEEDPVCGSAHCQIADYWSRELGKEKIVAYQASKRGGYLYCMPLPNGKMSISGEAVLVSVADILVGESNGMNSDYMIRKRGDEVIFTYGEVEYKLQSSAYEPCLYILNQEGEFIHTLHNAFDAYKLAEKFEAGETVETYGCIYDREAVCKVLIATIESGRSEMEWAFAASLVK